MLTPEQIIQNLSSENIQRYSAYDGAYELLTSLEKHILSDGMVIAYETSNFEDQFERERERYARVASDVIRDFIAWAKTHPHE